jgi:hypothetical protein
MTPPASGEPVFEEADSCTSAPEPPPAAVWMIADDADEVTAVLDGASMLADGLVGLPPHADKNAAASTPAASNEPERKENVLWVIPGETGRRRGRNIVRKWCRLQPDRLADAPRGISTGAVFAVFAMSLIMYVMLTKNPQSAREARAAIAQCRRLRSEARSGYQFARSAPVARCRTPGRCVAVESRCRGSDAVTPYCDRGPYPSSRSIALPRRPSTFAPRPPGDTQLAVGLVFDALM